MNNFNLKANSCLIAYVSVVSMSVTKLVLLSRNSNYSTGVTASEKKKLFYFLSILEEFFFFLIVLSEVCSLLFYVACVLSVVVSVR